MNLCHIPEERTFHPHVCRNIKPCKPIILFAYGTTTHLHQTRRFIMVFTSQILKQIYRFIIFASCFVRVLLLLLLLLLLFNYALQPLRLIVRSGLDVPTFATRRLYACHHARAPSGGRWNCEREMYCNFA